MAGVTPPDPGVGLWVIIVIVCVVLVVGYLIYRGYHNVRNSSYQRRKRKQAQEELEGLGKRADRRPNGTIITGALPTMAEQRPLLLAYQGSNSSPTSLPPDVWALIIAHATNTLPEPYSIHDLGAPTATSHPAIPEPELYKLYTQSLRIKCDLSRVCLQWKDITKPFRFGWIWIASPVQAQALGKLILKEEAAGVQVIDSCAWWIRRLYIDTTRYTSAVKVLDHKYWYKGTPFISKCPQLLHYRHTMKGVWEQATVPTLLLGEIFPLETGTAAYIKNLWVPLVHGTTAQSKDFPSVTTLEWTDMYPYHIYSYLQTNAHALTNALSLLQHLTIRTCPTHRTYDDRLPIQNGELHLPALHTLKVDDVRALTQPAKWNLPSLQALSISGNVRSTDHQKHIQTFLHFHGQKLRELELVAEFSFHDPLRYIEFDTLCPALEVLQICARFPWPDFVLKQTSLRWLSITHLEAEAIRGAQSAIIKHARKMKEHLPQLVAVQDNSFESERTRRKILEDPDHEHASNITAFYTTMDLVLAQADVEFVDWRKYPVAARIPNDAILKSPVSIQGYSLS